MLSRAMVGTTVALFLLLILETPAIASASTTVEPTSLSTLVGANVYFTVLNERNVSLFNITMRFPAALAPAGLDASSGRWVRSVAREGNSFLISWLGGPVEPQEAVTLGVAVVTPGGEGSYLVNISENYQGNPPVVSSFTIGVRCPCFLGIDVRTLSYSLIVIVLFLPVLEIALHAAHFTREGDEEKPR